MTGLYTLLGPVHRALLTAGVGLLTLPGVHHGVQRLLRPAAPAMACHLGEALVSRPRKVLAITAHPDDLAFFCGGTLARLADAGGQVHGLVLTDGEKGGSQAHLGEVRRREETQVAALLSLTDCTFCGLPDYGLPYEPRLLPTLEEAWRRLQPEVLLGFDPKELMPGSVNRDHQALGQALLELAGRPWAAGTEVYFYGTRHPNVLVDIRGVLGRKVAAVQLYDSQLRYLPRPLYPHLVRLYGSLSGGGVLPAAESLFRLV